MRHLIDKMIEEAGFEEIEAENAISITELETDFKTYFKHHFDPYFVDEHFEIPMVFKAYLNALEGTVMRSNWWSYLYGKTEVLEATKNSLGIWIRDVVDRRKNGTSYSTDTLWICFGGWSDKHEYIICCDKTHPDFGKIFDAYDDHPYLGEDFLKDGEWDDIEVFLMKYIRDEEDDDNWDG